MECNCEFLNDSKRSCRILKQLYCKTEPNKKCNWYKEKEEQENENDEKTQKEIYREADEETSKENV